MATRSVTALRNVVSGGVALIAAWSSYSHMVHLVLRYGERPEVAYALPFSVDGMLLVSTIVMADDKRHGHSVRPLARLAFVIGVAASVAANIAAAQPTLGARIIDAWPALALLLVVEMLARPPANATPAPEQATMSGPEHRDVPVAPASSSNASVPPANEVPTPQEVPLSAEPPRVTAVPPAYSAEAAPRTSPSPLPCLVPADSRHHQRRLQSVPYANDVRTAEATPAPPARHDDSASFVPADPQIAGPPEPPITAGEAAVPAEPHVAEPRPATPGHHLSAAAERGETAARTATHNPQRQSAESEAALRATTNGVAHDSSDGATTSARKTKVRRSATATRALAQSMMQAEPHLTKTEIALRLEISTRRLRDVLAS